MANFERIINLIKKTGDRVIVIDSQTNTDYVLMNVNEYERLVMGRSEVLGLTEQELLDKINRDVNIWKESQKQQEIPIDQYDFSQDLDDFNGAISDLNFSRDVSNFSEKTMDSATEDHYYFEPVE